MTNDDYDSHAFLFVILHFRPRQFHPHRHVSYRFVMDNDDDLYYYYYDNDDYVHHLLSWMI